MIRSQSVQTLLRAIAHSFLSPAVRIAIAGDWHANTEYARKPWLPNRDNADGCCERRES